MRKDQPVRVTVDALPDRVFTGKVQSLGPASGVSYSAIAPHNATGNFTKIVQRLPVRIALDPGQDGADRLRVGMSVQPEVDVSAPARQARQCPGRALGRKSGVSGNSVSGVVDRGGRWIIQTKKKH